MTFGAAGISVWVAFLAGVVSFASPCFLPVVPVFIGYMTGQQAGPGRERTTARSFALVNSLVFVAAFSAVFIALWTMVGLVGWAVGDYRGILRVVGGIILVVLGLHTMGLLKLPFLERTLRAPYSPAMGDAPTVRRSALLGLAFGAGWTPCIGPVLGAILGLATTSPSLGSGTWLLVVYSLGLGVPFVLAVAGVSGLTRRLSWFSRHHQAVSVVTGVMLVVVGFLMINDLFSRVATVVSTPW